MSNLSSPLALDDIVMTTYDVTSGNFGIMTTPGFPWWRHQMETFFASLAFYAGNSPVTGESPAQRPVTRGFDVTFDLRLNKPLSKNNREAGDLRRHCAHYDVIVIND